jgi:hypothetical protein
MINFALLCFALGAIAATAALAILVPVSWRALRAGGVVKALAIGAFIVPLLGLLLLTGRDGSRADDTDPAPTMATVASSTEGGEDWSLLSHMFLGGPPPSSTGTGAAAPATAREGHSIEDLKAMTAGNPGNAQAWLALANAQRQSRDYASAVASFDKALRIDAGSADAWADYADALASAGDRRLAGRPAEAIARALKLDAKHPKALWLQASLDLEQRNFAAALKHWQSLRAALPEGSPDVSIVDANIAEARQLLAQAATGG